MKRFFTVLSFLVMVGCAGTTPHYATIEKGEAAKFTGWHLTDEEFSEILKRAELCEVGK